MNAASFIAGLGVGYLFHASWAFRVELAARSFGRYAAVSIAAPVIYRAAFELGLLLWDPSGFGSTNALKLAALGASWLWVFIGYRDLACAGPEVL